jgi:hypothetical protein
LCNIFKLIVPIVLGLIFGAVYWDMDHSEKSIGNRQGILFFMAMNNAFGATISAATMLADSIRVVQRERQAGNIIYTNIWRNVFFKVSFCTNPKEYEKKVSTNKELSTGRKLKRKILLLHKQLFFLRKQVTK